MSNSEILLCSDPDYERLVAEVYIDGKCVATLTHEDPAEEPRIIIFSPNPEPATVVGHFDVDAYIHAIKGGQRRLLTLDAPTHTDDDPSDYEP